LEDAAQGFGGRIGEHRAVSFGDIATTSFFPAKPLGCYGDGGAVFTNSDQWAEYIRSFCLHGKGTTKYDNIRIGRNSRLDTIQAAILEVKLKSFIEYELEAINKVASIYSDALINRFDCPFIPSGYYSSFAQYTIKLKDGQERERLINKLASKGIPSMVYYPIPLHRQGAYKGMMRRDDDYPVSEKLAQTVLSLPIDPDMTENDVMAVVAAFSENEVVK
jgi:dTDP-4-amino-4,6-dideoxygalactose transaminase